MDLKNPTRTEALLANIAGHTDVPVPDMKNATRSERLLKEILDNGGGGGGDVTKEYVDTAIADAVADIDDDISALSDTVADKVDKENGKGLSTNDYTDADKALVQDSPITITATASPISTANGKPRKLTIYGKSEVVDGAIKSAGESWSVVRLADLTWTTTEHTSLFQTFIRDMYRITNVNERNKHFLCDYYARSTSLGINTQMDNQSMLSEYRTLYVYDKAYTTISDFVASLGDVTLCYELDDPSRGNTIAIKTDNGTGIDGTMAVFSTGTPLRGITGGARDVAEWDGSSGEVTKKCNKVRLADLTWGRTGITSLFQADVSDMYSVTTIGERNKHFLCSSYLPSTTLTIDAQMDDPSMLTDDTKIFIYDTRYSELSNFTASLGDAELIYELATPTTEQLTTAENDSIAGLRTFEPQTHVQNNAQTDMTVEAYAGTQNGKAISDMQPTRSPLLTLSASGWTNNTQTVTYEHNTGKRNTIDVEPANIKAWTAAGILATAETASTITFECDTAPTADLSFRVTSMEVR